MSVLEVLASAAAWWAVIFTVTGFVLWRVDRRGKRPDESRPLAPVIQLGPKQAAHQRRRSAAR